MHEQLYYCDATDLATLVRSKQVSPIEIAQVHLERIQWLNPRLNAVVTLNESAMEEARAKEAALMRGASLGPLYGVPFTVKDSLDTAGLRTVRGSRLFSGLWMPPPWPGSKQREASSWLRPTCQSSRSRGSPTMPCSGVNPVDGSGRLDTSRSASCI